jgi:hypothetical protein
MKKILLIGAIMGSLFATAQTNRINHYSHSGSLATLDIFKANDNMGLGCGSAYTTEFTPAIDTNTILWDSVQLDSTKVCTPQPPKQSMKAIDPRVDTSKVYNRGPK